jgi:hypothetical protein
MSATSNGTDNFLNFHRSIIGYLKNICSKYRYRLKKYFWVLGQYNKPANTEAVTFFEGKLRLHMHCSMHPG